MGIEQKYRMNRRHTTLAVPLTAYPPSFPVIHTSQICAFPSFFRLGAWSSDVALADGTDALSPAAGVSATCFLKQIVISSSQNNGAKFL